MPLQEHVQQRLTRHIECVLKKHRSQVNYLSAKSTPLLNDADAKQQFQLDWREIRVEKRKLRRQIARMFHFDVLRWRPIGSMIFGNDLPEMLWKYNIVVQTEKLAVLFFRNTEGRGAGLSLAYAHRRFRLVSQISAASTWGTGIRFVGQYAGQEV